MKKEKLNIYKPVEDSFLAELHERLEFLKGYFNSKYKPLKAEFKVYVRESDPNIVVEYRLLGAKYFMVALSMSILRIASEMRNGVQEEYIKNIQRGLEEAIRQEGIRSINERFL